MSGAAAIPMILQAAGGVLQGVAAKKAQLKMFDEYKKEVKRQDAYAQEALGMLHSRVGSAGVEGAEQQMEAGRNQRLADFSNALRLNLAPTNNLSLTPQDRAAFDVTTKSRAKLGSYSDWALKQAIQDIKTQQALNQVSSFAAGTSQVFPYRQYDAQHAYDWLSSFGQALGAAGGTASNFQALYGGEPQKQAPSYWLGTTIDKPAISAPISYSTSGLY